MLFPGSGTRYCGETPYIITTLMFYNNYYIATIEIIELSEIVNVI